MGKKGGEEYDGGSPGETFKAFLGCFHNFLSFQVYLGIFRNMKKNGKWKMKKDFLFFFQKIVSKIWEMEKRSEIS